MRRPREAVTVNLSRAEKQTVEKAAESMHLAVSAFIRLAALEKATVTNGATNGGGK